MLAKAFRFHGHNSLRFVYGKGKLARVNCLQLKYTPNSRNQESRVAVVVSKKVVKQAPVRNRIRRRVYEVVRSHWSMITPGYDLVITVFDDRVATIDHSELNRLVVELLHKAEVYKK